MSLRAYPLAWANNSALRTVAGRWQRRGLLSASQRTAIEAAYPISYYRPTWWVQVALLLTTGFCIAATSTFLVVLVTDWHPLVYNVLLLIASLVSLEILIKTSKHYRSGSDNALLYSALVAWSFIVGYALRDTGFYSLSSPRLALWLLPVLLALGLALLRYADPVVAAASLGAALALLANVLLQFSVGRLLLPFAGMLASGALLVTLRAVPQRADFFYYRAAYLTLRILGLAILYLAGNYLVVREGNAALQGGYGSSAEIPFAALFWVFTAALPLVYIWLGLRRYDRLLLWLGVLALAFAIYTVRTYHSVLPPAMAATLAGALLTALALGALRYLRTPRHGLTAEADDEMRPPINLESFITLETAHVPHAPVPGFEFGGGSSGGGGAEGRF